MLQLPVYMDNHATTRVDPRVLESMLPFFTETYGNAASVTHSFGSAAADAVAHARLQIAELLNTTPNSIVFTSGATEANNIALKGTMRAAGFGRHLITAAAEHRAVLDPVKRLKRDGYDVSILPVDETGMVDPQQVAEAMKPNTVLVSVMAANNEVGTLNDIAEIGRLCRSRDVLFHTDAAQAVGHIPLDLAKLSIDLMSFSAHKLYGPKGIGALYVNRSEGRIPIEPLFDGGGHEMHLRSGTLPVPSIVGFGRACQLAQTGMNDEAVTIRALRDRLWDQLERALEGIVLNGHPDRRLPGNLNVSFEGVDGEALMTGLKNLAVSSGSACTSAEPEPSHVLRAMGRSDAMTRASLRFGLGRFNTAEEVDFAATTLVEAVGRLRGLASKRT